MRLQRRDLSWGRLCLAITVNFLLLILAAAPAQGQAVVSTVPAGNGPDALAVNTVTNKIYVANGTSNNVTVIDGVTNATTTVTDPNAVGPPVALAVNSVTNKIYVGNAGYFQNRLF